MKHNPITQYLTRNHRWPPLRGAGLIALGVCAVSMTAFVFDTDLAGRIGLFAAWLLMVINPLVIAVMSPLLTRQTTRDEQYQLLKLTPLSSDEIRHGCVRAVLFRWRVPLAVQIGLLPVWVAELFISWYAMWAFYAPSQPPENPNFAAPLIMLSLMGIGSFGMNLVAAVFGVEQGFRSGHSARGIATSVGFVLLIPVLSYIPALTLLGPAIGALWWDMPTSLRIIGMTFGFFVVLPYGVAALYYWSFKRKR